MSLIILNAICIFNGFIFAEETLFYMVRSIHIKNRTTSVFVVDNFTSDLAVDGDIFTCSCNRPDPVRGNDPWWMVDLGIVYNIKLVRLFYTEDYTLVLDWMWIFVSNDTMYRPGCSPYFRKPFEYHGQTEFDFVCEHPVIGKYVWIENPIYMVVCEVLVFAELKSSNLAYSGPVIHNGIIPFDHAGLTNDGDIWTCVLLKSTDEEDSWMYVKLDDVYYVTEINLFYKRIHAGVQLFVSDNDANHEDNWCAATRDPPTSTGTPPQEMLLKCKKPKLGRYVSLKNLKEHPIRTLILCELEVFAKGYAEDEKSNETSTSCLEHEYKCLKGDCIHKDWLCDGTYDCPHDDDEPLSCQGNRTQFKCKRRNEKISLKYRCDGKYDCSDYSDEEHCFNLHEEPLMATFKGESKYHVCSDGWIDKYSLEICNEFNRDLFRTRKIYRYDYNLDNVLKIRPDFTNAHRGDHLTSLWANSSACNSNMFIGVDCAMKKDKVDTCGKRAFPDSLYGPYIFNGQKATHGAWPWHVDVVISPFFIQSSCGGSIINERWILTAAHCFAKNENIRDILVGVGLRVRDDVFMVYRVTHLILHPEFNETEFVNDLALLRLDRRISFSRLVKPICLPQKILDQRTLLSFRHCVMTGFGYIDSEMTLPTHLQQARMDIIDNKKCVRYFDSIKGGNISFTEKYMEEYKLMCAGQIPLKDGKNTCKGDSGGALVCKVNSGTWTQVGISSHSIIIGNNAMCSSSIFTKVDYFLDFIHTTMKVDYK